jgi:hypothetical protein
MTEETNKSNQQSETTDQTVAQPIPKELIDKPTDFRFHAAYMVYSDSWDQTSSSETKLKLNEAIKALSEDKIDYETFYRQINNYRAHHGPDSDNRRSRAFIETQRKRDWRKREERASRNKRHGR